MLGPEHSEEERMTRRDNSIVCLMLFSSLLLASCATTKTTAEWRDENVNKRYAKILVIGVAAKPPVRRIFEDQLASRLREQNVDAEAAFRLLPAETKLTKESIKQAIAGKGYDGVLVTHLVGVTEKETYYPPVYRPVAVPRYRNYYGYYTTVYEYVREPGYYDRYKVVRLETSLFDTGSEGIAWSLQSETIDPQSTQAVIDRVIDKAVKALKKQKLI